MDGGTYIVGSAATVVVVGALVHGAGAVRRAALPGWAGARAALAQTVIALGLGLAVARLAGAVGLLTGTWCCRPRWGPGSSPASSPAVGPVATRRRPGWGRRRVGGAGLGGRAAEMGERSAARPGRRRRPGWRCRWGPAGGSGRRPARGRRRPRPTRLPRRHRPGVPVGRGGSGRWRRGRSAWWWPSGWPTPPTASGGAWSTPTPSGTTARSPLGSPRPAASAPSTAWATRRPAGSRSTGSWCTPSGCWPSGGTGCPRW